MTLLISTISAKLRSPTALVAHLTLELSRILFVKLALIATTLLLFAFHSTAKDNPVPQVTTFESFQIYDLLVDDCGSGVFSIFQDSWACTNNKCVKTTKYLYTSRIFSFVNFLLVLAILAV